MSLTVGFRIRVPITLFSDIANILINELPLDNTSGTFTNLNTTISTSNNDGTLITIDVVHTLPSGTRLDSLSNYQSYFNNDGIKLIGSYRENADITFISFNIGTKPFPLSDTGAQFKKFAGTIQDDGIGPYILINVSSCFYELIGNNCFISKWNMTNVTYMRAMFYNAINFNQYIGEWNTSNVTDMGSMFRNAHSFNQDIGGWNTFNVTDMSYMFYNAHSFNQNISTKVVGYAPNQYMAWNTENVTNMAYMLNVNDYPYSVDGEFNNGEGTAQSTSPLNWNTSKVENMDYLFKQCRKFNQNCSTQYVNYNLNGTNYSYLAWNTENVTIMRRTFAYCESFNNGELEGQSTSPLKWNTSKVTTMNYMFGLFNFLLPGTNGKGKYNQPMNTEDIIITNPINSSETTSYTQWNVESVTNMWLMFQNAHSFNQYIGDWNTSKVTTMYRMFSNAHSFNQDIGDWVINSVQVLDSMFYNAYSFNQNISNWNTSNVLYMGSMFQNAHSFNHPGIASWNFTNTTNINYFISNSGFTTETYGEFIGRLALNTTLPSDLNIRITGFIYNPEQIYESKTIRDHMNVLISSVLDGGKNLTIESVENYTPEQINAIVNSYKVYLNEYTSGTTIETTKRIYLIDSGGLEGTYLQNENYEIIFKPGGIFKKLNIQGFFSGQQNSDYLHIYNETGHVYDSINNDTNEDGIIDVFNNINVNGSFLKVVFNSNQDLQNTGFNLIVTPLSQYYTPITVKYCFY